MLRTIMEQLETDPVPLGASHIPSHIPPRRCGGLSFKFVPCASRRDTRHERDATRDDEHHGPAMPTAHSLHAAGRRARSRARRDIRVSGRRRRVVVGGVFRTFRNYPECHNQPKIRGAPPRLGKI